MLHHVNTGSADAAVDAAADPDANEAKDADTPIQMQIQIQCERYNALMMRRCRSNLYGRQRI